MKHRDDYEQMKIVFDAKQGEEAKEAGIALAEEHHAADLDFAREIALQIGLRQDTVSADDVQLWLFKNGYQMLGPEGGHLFEAGLWEWTGDWVKSQRVSNHARMLRVWRLKGKKR